MKSFTGHKLLDITRDEGFVYYNQPFYNNPAFLDIGYGKSYGTHYGIFAQKSPSFALPNAVWIDELNSTATAVEFTTNVRKFDIGYGTFYGRNYGQWQFYRFPRRFKIGYGRFYGKWYGGPGINPPLFNEQQPQSYKTISIDLSGTKFSIIPIPVHHWSVLGFAADDENILYNQCPSPVLLVRTLSFHNDYTGFGIEVDP